MQELSLNILDIAENSVRADARLVRIEVSASPADDRLAIVVEDDGKGMDADTLKGVTDPFYTTRTTRNVGFGLPYMKMNAELTDGALKVESSPGAGTKVVASFGLSHIDRAPLGDMGQTMSVLAGSNPGMDFIYKLSADGEDFIFDTGEIKRVLDGVPISEPEVMAYMVSYITENTRKVITQYGI
jgi:anti-sigma regulatory factor (Ser/Thr protein kinase)